jgi:hypothetical protein
MPRFPFVCLLLALVAAPSLPGAARAQDLAPAETAAAPGLAEAGSVADAPRDLTLYQGEAELLSQGAGERRAAAARALAQVLVKLTGDPLAPGNPVVRRALANAESFVSDSHAGEASSDQEGNTAVGGVPVYKTTMDFAFDPGSVDALVAGAGLRVWGSPRPRPILWLAIDDGRGARLVNSQQLNVVKPLAQRGLQRGLRFGMPSGSAVEQAAVQTIWAQNPEPMQALTARYGGDAQLLGRVYRAGGGWTADWVLSRGGQELSRWSFSDPSPQRAIASGADGAADAIARRDAVLMDAGEPGQLLVELVGLRDSNDYARAMGYLQTLAVVRALHIVEASPDRVQLQLDLAVGPDGFARFVASGGTLEADPLAPEGAARFRLKP